MTTKTYKFSTLFAAVAVVCTLAGCAGNQINAGTTALKEQTQPVVEKSFPQQGLLVTEATKGTSAFIEAQAQALRNQPVAKRASGPWYGQRTIPTQSDSQLPEIFKKAFKIDFDGYRGGRVPIAVVAERLSRMSGVPVRVSPDVYQDRNKPVVGGSGGAQPPRAAPMPMAGSGPMPTPLGRVGSTGANLSPIGLQDQGGDIGTTELNAVSMKWDGSLEGFLDHVTGMLNLSSSFRDGVVNIERYMTESFEISSFGGTQDYKMSISGGNNGTSGGSFGSASAVLDVAETGKMSALDSLKKSVEAMVRDSGGSVTLNEGTGRFTVVAPKDVLSRVRQFIRDEDAALNRQAHIQIDIYSVTNKSNDEYGVDWSGFINNLATTWGGAITMPASLVSTAAAGASYTLLKDIPATSTQPQLNNAARYGGSKVLLQALHQMGESAAYRPVSIIAKNRQWARKTNLITTGYVSETVPSTSTTAGSGAPGQKTSVVTTGDKFAVQAAIMSDGSIDMKFAISLTDLIGLFEVTAGSGASLQRVQTPETSGTDDQGTVRLKAGEAMVITGLSRRVSTSDRNGLAEEIPVALGGSKKRSYKQENFLVVVRATPF